MRSPYEIQLISSKIKLAFACNMTWLIVWKGYFWDVISYETHIPNFYIMAQLQNLPSFYYTANTVQGHVWKIQKLLSAVQGKRRLLENYLFHDTYIISDEP